MCRDGTDASEPLPLTPPPPVQCLYPHPPPPHPPGLASVLTPPLLSSPLRSPPVEKSICSSAVVNRPFLLIQLSSPSLLLLLSASSPVLSLSRPQGQGELSLNLSANTSLLSFFHHAIHFLFQPSSLLHSFSLLLSPGSICLALLNAPLPLNPISFNSIRVIGLSVDTILSKCTGTRK